MRTRTTARRLALLALWVAAGPAGASAAPASPLPGPRQPLTFRDMGLYGGWNDYWLSDACPFGFFIVQAWVDPKGEISAHGMERESNWGQWLKRARARGKRIIADVTPRGWKSSKTPLEDFKKALDVFMAGVDESRIYCITLDEENIYWNGHLDVLRQVYAYAKAKYRVPVYQWYSPAAGPPGFGWPQLPADGWLIDEYAHGGASFERFIRSYAVHQLPVVHIVWGSPLMREFDWEKAGDPAFDWQIAVCRKYDIPCSFFVWEGHGNVWGWSPEALPTSKAVFQRALEWTRRAAATDPKPYEATWDDWPSLQPLSLTCGADQGVSFQESFTASGGLVGAGAATKGFRDLRWDGGSLDLRPRRPGWASAVLEYPLRCDFPMSGLVVHVAGSVQPRLGGRIAVSASPDGRAWSAERVLAGGTALTLPLAGDPRFAGCRSFRVRVVVSGQRRKAGDVPASVESIRVAGRFEPPTAKEIRVPVAPVVPLRWEASFAGASFLFTGEVENQKELETGPGFIGTHGVAGYSNHVSIRQKIVLEKPADLLRIVSRNHADQGNFGATNSLGVSLDGKEILAEQKTSGQAIGAELVLDLSKDSRFKGIGEFWVHLGMFCGCGVKTDTTNRITGLVVEGMGAKAGG